ncbi:MAG: hypothetical protein J0L53_13035 [Spirochaetes bacterium]|nr:hypothetical protein [Spirochaetota bacterium]MBX3723295.1 hypothetical protein [Turneriella sp.]
MKVLFAMIAAVAAVFPAFADQFAYVRPEMARRAEALLKNESEMLQLCEPCGESKGQVEKILKVETADVNFEGNHEVRINNKGVDLAYIFVKRGTKWKNVAVLLGVRPFAVSAELPANPPGQPLPGY